MQLPTIYQGSKDVFIQLWLYYLYVLLYLLNFSGTYENNVVRFVSLVHNAYTAQNGQGAWSSYSKAGAFSTSRSASICPYPFPCGSRINTCMHAHIAYMYLLGHDSCSGGLHDEDLCRAHVHTYLPVGQTVGRLSPLRPRSEGGQSWERSLLVARIWRTVVTQKGKGLKVDVSLHLEIGLGRDAWVWNTWETCYLG